MPQCVWASFLFTERDKRLLDEALTQLLKHFDHLNERRAGDKFVDAVAAVSARSEVGTGKSAE